MNETEALQNSMFRFALALTLLAGRELTSLMFDPLTPLRDVSALLNTMADTIADCLGPSRQALYWAGDEVQRRMTDFLLFSGATSESSTGWGPVVNDGSDC